MNSDLPVTRPHAVHVTNGDDCATAVWHRADHPIFVITVRDGLFDAERLDHDGEVTENLMFEAARAGIASDRSAPDNSLRHADTTHSPIWTAVSVMGTAVRRAERAGGPSAQAIFRMFERIDRDAFFMTTSNYMGAASYDSFVADAPHGRRLKEIYRRHPWLRKLVLPEKAAAAAGGLHRLLIGSPDEAAVAILTGVPDITETFPSGLWPITTAAVRSMAQHPDPPAIPAHGDDTIMLKMASKGTTGDPTREVLAVMSALPPSWLPAQVERDFVSIAQSLSLTVPHGICDGPEDLLGLLAGTGGRLKDAFTPDVPDQPWNVPVHSFGYAMLDLVHYLDAWRRDFGWLATGRAATDDVQQSRIPAALATDMHAFLFGGRTLRRLLKASEAWHRNERTIRHGTAGEPCIEVSWPALTEPFTASNGVAVVPLTDERMLDDEGNDGICEDGSGGLSHCIGGFAWDCLDGQIHVYSVRRPGAGGFTRLSTLAVTVGEDGGILEDEHRGHENVDPPEEALMAVRSFFDAIEAGNLAVAPEAMTSGRSAIPEPAAPEPEAALRAWRPLLREGVRDMSPDEAVEAFARYRARRSASSHRPGPEGMAAWGPTCVRRGTDAR